MRTILPKSSVSRVTRTASGRIRRLPSSACGPATVAGALALESNLRLRPIAVRVTIDTEDFGKIVRIFEVAG